MSAFSRTLVWLCILQAACVTAAADEADEGKSMIGKIAMDVAADGTVAADEAGEGDHLAGKIYMDVSADGSVSLGGAMLEEDMEVNAKVSGLMEEVEEMARSGVTPQPDKITIIKNIVNDELLPDLKATRQSSIDQIATNLAAIETCNKHGVETQQNIASSTEVAVGSARSTHTACRTEEKNKKSTKVARCKELDDFLNDVAVPVTMPSPKERGQMVPYVQKMSSYFCPKGPTVTKMNKACKTAEKEHEEHKASCDKKQAVFEMAFCQWRTHLEDTCTALDQCYNGALATHTKFVEATKVLEKKWKLEYSSLKKIVCYTGVWLTDNKVSSENLEKCASSTIDTSPMNIIYPDVPEQAQCSTTKVDIYPGSTEFPNKEYKNFLDFAVAVIPCCGPSPPTPTVGPVPTPSPTTKPAQLLKCGGQTLRGSTKWQFYSSDGIYTDVDTSACGFSVPPVYTASLGGDSSHWSSTGGSELYKQTKTGFRVYVNKRGITTAQANSWKWQVNWHAQPEGKLSSGLCTGRTTPGSTKWQFYSKDGIFADVDTSACGFSALPVYATSLGGDSSHWTSRGGSELYKQTKTGFRVYVYKKGITTAQANSWKWQVNWMAQPEGKLPSGLCAGHTPPGSTKWQHYSSNGIYADVDTSACGFSALPVYKASLGGDSNHWTSNGGSELYKQTKTGFRVYVHKSGITTAQANSWNWHINWMATPQGKTEA